MGARDAGEDGRREVSLDYDPWGQELFDYLQDELRVIAVLSQLQEIVRIAAKLVEEKSE